MGVGRESRGQAAITGSEKEHVIQRQCTARRPRHCSSGNRISTFLQLTTPTRASHVHTLAHNCTQTPSKCAAPMFSCLCSQSCFLPSVVSSPTPERHCSPAYRDRDRAALTIGLQQYGLNAASAAPTLSLISLSFVSDTFPV